ncbi:MAG: phosphoribosyltransferase family protein [Patescibacteria group bacterium]|nr:phosphoribosyltransferase family protein [Patescibacteria group bacterium]
MNEQEALEVFCDTGAIQEGHFVLASSCHASKYIDKERLYQHPHKIAKLCRAIAENFVDYEIDIVIGPEMGGIIPSQWVAYHLTNFLGHEVFSIYATKSQDGNFVIKDKHREIVADKKALIVEDIISSGGSIKRVIEATRAVGGDIVGLGALWNRGKVTEQDLNIPILFSLVNIEIKVWDVDKCPYWLKKIPIDMDIGRGRYQRSRLWP